MQDQKLEVELRYKKFSEDNVVDPTTFKPYWEEVQQMYCQTSKKGNYFNRRG
jgi:hypothetical protein